MLQLGNINTLQLLHVKVELFSWQLQFYNLGQNIQILFHFLVEFVFTTSEKELDYYHQKVNVRIASGVAERLKTQDFRKLGNFKKITEMLGFDGQYTAVHPKANFLRFLEKNCKKSAEKHSIEKLILLNFVNLSPTFCPGLYFISVNLEAWFLIFLVSYVLKLHKQT